MKFLVELRNRLEYRVLGPIGTDEARDRAAVDMWKSTPGQVAVFFWKAEQGPDGKLLVGEQYTDEWLEEQANS